MCVQLLVNVFLRWALRLVEGGVCSCCEPMLAFIGHCGPLLAFISCHGPTLAVGLCWVLFVHDSGSSGTGGGM
jgi:hypothetical protein